LIEARQCHEPGRPEVRSNRGLHFSPRGVSQDKVERHEGVEERELFVEASPGGLKVVTALVRDSEGVLLGVDVHGHRGPSGQAHVLDSDRVLIHCLLPF
jgi:hypothetical protein